jgi:hypothetical protein
MYLGEINHKGESFPADHPPIIEKDLFDAVQNVLTKNQNREDMRLGKSNALLLGLLFDDRGNRMSPSHAVEKGVRYRYYISTPILQGRKQDAGSVCRVPANVIEGHIIEALRERTRVDAQARNASNGSVQELTGKDLLRQVDRIELRADRILITMCAGAGQEPDEEQDQRPDLDSSAHAAIAVLWKPPSSRRKRDIILPVGLAPGSRIKPLRNEERLKFLRAITIARSLRDALLPVPQESIVAMASRHRKTERWARKHLTLAFLDPELVQAAVDGVLPRGYGLSRFFDLPADWEDQWRVLGLASPRRHHLADAPQKH